MKKLISYFALATTSLLSLLPLLAKAQEAENLYFGTEFIGEIQTGGYLGTRDIRAVIAGIINVIMGFLGIIAVIIILIGGFMWMTAGGNEEKVGKAKKMIMSGIIGLVIVIAAFAIARFVVTQITGITQETTY